MAAFRMVALPEPPGDAALDSVCVAATARFATTPAAAAVPLLLVVVHLGGRTGIVR